MVPGSKQMKKSFLKASVDWVEMLKVLADEERLQIIQKLLKRELSVSELAGVIGVETYTMSRHLKKLESSGLVKKRKMGNRRIYKIPGDLKHGVSACTTVLDLGCCKFNFTHLK
jgi:DNA-binding transcriptional ArsR family regulator